MTREQSRQGSEEIHWRTPHRGRKSGVAGSFEKRVEHVEDYGDDVGSEEPAPSFHEILVRVLHPTQSVRNENRGQQKQQDCERDDEQVEAEGLLLPERLKVELVPPERDEPNQDVSDPERVDGIKLQRIPVASESVDSLGHGSEHVRDRKADHD